MALRFVGVAEEEPLHPATWSGSSAYFFSSLQEAGHLAATISAEPSSWTAAWFKAINFHPSLPQWKFKYSLDVGLYNHMTRIARRKLGEIRSSAYDAILQIGGRCSICQGNRVS